MSDCGRKMVAETRRLRPVAARNATFERLLSRNLTSEGGRVDAPKPFTDFRVLVIEG
jgi:hypothetical protein